jgi:hypothetical protein
MIDEKLKAVLEMFAGLNHGEQVDLFLAIKEGLLKNRQIRLQEHEANRQVQEENIKALCAGNDAIIGNNGILAKQG